MKKWLSFLLLLQMVVGAGAQTVGDRPSSLMITNGGTIMVPLKRDFLSDMGLSRVRPVFSSGVQYYLTENWGVGVEAQGGLIGFSDKRARSANRKAYIPKDFRMMDLEGNTYSQEWIFVGGGVSFRKMMDDLWLEAGVLTGVTVFDLPTKMTPVYYKEQGTNFIYQHARIQPEVLRVFMVSPRISAQYKLAQRLGISISLGVVQPFKSVDYQMKFKNVFTREEDVIEHRGSIDAPTIFSRVSLIFNLAALKRNKRDAKGVVLGSNH